MIPGLDPSFFMSSFQWENIHPHMEIMKDWLKKIKKLNQFQWESCNIQSSIHFPSICSIFENALTTSGPGSQITLFSALQYFLNVPMTENEKKKSAEVKSESMEKLKIGTRERSKSVYF